MDKELSSTQPSFSRLVDDVARTMEACGDPNRTYSMMDEYDESMYKDKCYVICPFWNVPSKCSAIGRFCAP